MAASGIHRDRRFIFLLTFPLVEGVKRIGSQHFNDRVRGRSPAFKDIEK